MGSVKKHRKINSDCESIQWRPKPGRQGSMTYGFTPYMETPWDITLRLGFREPEGFYTYYDTQNFKRTYKA